MNGVETESEQRAVLPRRSLVFWVKQRWSSFVQCFAREQTRERSRDLRTNTTLHLSLTDWTSGVRHEAGAWLLHFANILGPSLHPHSVLSNEYRVLSGRNVKLTTYSHPVERLRIHGVLPPLLIKMFWRSDDVLRLTACLPTPPAETERIRIVLMFRLLLLLFIVGPAGKILILYPMLNLFALSFILNSINQ